MNPTQSTTQPPLHVIIAAHGSSFHPGGVEAAEMCRDAVLQSGAPCATVRCAFWKGGDLNIRDAIDACPPGRVLVIPLLMGDGFFASKVFPQALGVEPHHDWQERGVHTVRVAAPAGLHPGFSSLLAAQAEKILQAHPDASLVLAAHGTERDPESGRRIYELADELAPLFHAHQRPLHVGFLDQAPLLETLLPTITTPTCVILPWFAADGYHAADDIPALVADHARVPVTVLPSVGPLLFPAICTHLVQAAYVNDPVSL